MIGNYIKSKRNELNLSQKELADKLNISIQRLNNFENESRIPPLTLLEDLSIHLNFNIDNLNQKNQNCFTFDLKLLAINLIKYRQENNLTLQELSKLIKVSRQTISKWEKGESYPNIDLFYDITKLLMITPSSLICSKNEIIKKKKFNFKILIPFILISTLIIFIIVINKNKIHPLKDSSSLSSSYSLIASSEESSSIEMSTSQEMTIVTDTFISQSTIDLINNSIEQYNALKPNDILKDYKIYFNDENIKDINFYPSEKVILPFYFDNEKYIDHYLLDNQKLSGLVTLDYSFDLYLTPVYIYYEDYLNSLEVEFSNTNTMRYIIKSIKEDSSIFIIPSHFRSFSSFEIKSINSNITTFISSDNYLTFNGYSIDYLPSMFFFDFKNIEFINQNYQFDYLDFVAFYQSNDNFYSSDFIKVEIIDYLYLSANDDYDNFINIDSNINNLILSDNTSSYNKFIIGIINNKRKKLKI